MCLISTKSIKEDKKCKTIRKAASLFKKRKREKKTMPTFPKTIYCFKMVTHNNFWF